MQNFRDVNWGEDEAKGDPDLGHYFMKIPDFDNIIEGKKRYIIGRKGTGKTAILEKIRYESKSNSIYHTKDLSLRDFPLNDIRGLRDKSMQDKSQFVPAWTFLMMIELCKLIANDEAAQNYVIRQQITDFLNDNKLNLSGGFVETVKVLSSKQAKVNLSFSIFGGEGSKSNGLEFEVPIHFTKAIDPLKKLLNKITSNSKYFILFDELDEGYKVGDAGKRLLLLSLFRAMENLVLELREFKFSFRPILALRSDIYDNLEDNDLNKYDDFIIRLNWQADSRFNYSLRELVNTRIHHSINTDLDDPWNIICNDLDLNIPVSKKKSVWRYMHNRTFERPRDMIKFLKYCKEKNHKGPLTYQNVSDAENSYSDWFYREIRDEIQSHLPIWKESIAALAKIGKGVLTTKELESMLLLDKEILSYLQSSNKTATDIIEILFEFSVIGNLDDDNRWLFKYKDHDLVYSASRRLTVHFGLSKKLRLNKYF